MLSSRLAVVNEQLEETGKAAPRSESTAAVVLLAVGNRTGRRPYREEIAASLRATLLSSRLLTRGALCLAREPDYEKQYTAKTMNHSVAYSRYMTKVLLIVNPKSVPTRLGSAA